MLNSAKYSTCMLERYASLVVCGVSRITSLLVNALCWFTVLSIFCAIYFFLIVYQCFWNLWCLIQCLCVFVFPADPTALGFIISPWSLLLMPSGNISFTDENVTQQDLRAFTSPEVLEGLNLSSLSDMEKVPLSSSSWRSSSFTF